MTPGQRSIETAYRTLAELPVESPTTFPCGEKREVWVGSGKLMRSVNCPTPGWFARWWFNVRPGEVWKCKYCNARHTWTDTIRGATWTRTFSGQ